jgi:hypothetical protein
MDGIGKESVLSSPKEYKKILEGKAAGFIYRKAYNEYNKIFYRMEGVNSMSLGIVQILSGTGLMVSFCDNACLS